MDDKASDQDLIRSVLSGRQEDYAELVRRHHAKVMGLCLSMLGPAQAEDAAQEVFLKAYGSLSEFHGEAAFSTWLYRIASNQCLDMTRRAARKAEDSLDTLLEAEGDRIQALLAEPDKAQGEEARDLVGRVLALLPPEYRLILTLREVQGLDYKELMEALDCSMDSVKARLRRARQSFLEKLRHFSKLEDV